MVAVPAELVRLCDLHSPERSAWARGVSEKIALAAADMGLSELTVLGHGQVSLIISCSHSSGERVCLKLTSPDAARAELRALTEWRDNGVPCVRVIESSEELGAILLERLDGGELPMDERAPSILAEIIVAISAAPSWNAPKSNSQVIERRIKRGARFADNSDDPLLGVASEAAISAYRALPERDMACVLHCDLKPAHVLSGSRGWKLIDPKVASGAIESEIAIAAVKSPWNSYGPIERSLELGELCSELGASVSHSELELNAVIEAANRLTHRGHKGILTDAERSDLSSALRSTYQLTGRGVRGAYGSPIQRG